MKKSFVYLLILALAVPAVCAQKRFSVLGDSYSAFPGDVTPSTNDCWYGTKGTVEKGTTDVTELSQCWWRILCDKYGYELDTNNSYSGSTVGFTGYGGNDYSDFGFLTRINNLGNPDIIFVFGGTNDAWIPAPLGRYEYAEWNKNDLYSFRPAFAKLISQLQELYPSARIYNIVNSDLGDDVPRSIDQICRHYGVDNIELRDIDKLTGHPSVQGMQQIADQIDKYMHRTDKVKIFPMPTRIDVSDGTYDIRAGKITINCPEIFAKAPEMLAELLGKGFSIKRVKKNADVRLIQDGSVAAGGYLLNVTSKGVEIKASDYEGASHALASLVQMFPPECLAESLPLVQLPCVDIEDAPRYEWRGLLFDSSRHFWTVDEAKKQLKTMALFKLNRFHWHLTDSQEWRIPMDGFPQFELGCYRPLDGYIDRGCFERQAASDGNTDFDFPADRMRITQPGDTIYGGEMSAEMRISEGGDTIYGGHYTREDIAEVIAYADMLGIEVVPEIDMPGHFRGASKLLPWLSCDYIPFAAVCPGRDTTLDFCKHVLSEVFKMFPSKKIHIGGDEVDRSHWRTCPDCQHRADSLGLESTDQLQAWFVREIAQYVKDNGHEVIGWQEIADDGFKEGTQATIMWWLGEDPGVVKRAIAKGFDVICCPRQMVYLDYDENHRSLYKILHMRPSEYCGDGEQALSHIKGVQGNMWTEWVPSIQRLEYMVWPRLMAISHMGWTENSITDEEYYSLMEPQFRRLDAYGINYHAPTLEGFDKWNKFTGDDTLTIINRMPYLQVRYTTDGSRPTIDSPVYTGPIKVTGPTHFRFGTFRPDGRCIDVYDAHYK